jgi:hypothetical protein
VVLDVGDVVHADHVGDFYDLGNTVDLGDVGCRR